VTTSTYSVTRSDTDVKEVWRKVQYGIVQAFQFGVEEWEWLMKLQKFDVDWSAREITVELDLNDDINTASIPEGGYEAIPSSQTMVTATVTWILLNKRFTQSKTAEYITQQQGNRGQLEAQLRVQARKGVDGVRRKVGDMFYGFSTGTQCVVTSASNEVITVQDMYSVSGLGATTSPDGVTTSNRLISDLFRVNERIAVLTSAATFRGISTISSIASSSTITVVTTIASVTTGDLIVFANNLENTTTAGGTERNLNLVGLLDGITSTSVHSVSSATYARWASAINNSAGGRFTTVKYQKLRDSIYNNGGGELDLIIMADGVYRDVVSQQAAGLRFTDPFNLELGAEVKTKGVQLVHSRRVPDGYVFGLVKKNSVRKMTLLPEPQQLAQSDGYKLQDLSGNMFSIDYPCAMVWTNRKNSGLYSGLTQS
jgi:hypothetical protein